MPLFKTIQFNKTTQILVWKITETYQELFDSVIVNPTNLTRLSKMKSELHQRAFLSVRRLFQEIGHTDLDLHYDALGKPHIKGENHISITHSHEFSAIIISDETVGIDMELQRNKIMRIADKFVEEEFQYLEPDSPEEYIKKLTVIWGAKEAIFKIRNEKGISFKNHIRVKTFENIAKTTTATLHFGGLVKDFRIYFEEIEGFTLVFALEKQF
ncbi:4'-phosphopantetheinyl transferase superfamily protein [Flavobacterium sp. F-380]|uniref:4'-phosphopantetheinyl transferase superfamily protein n=1 Tax=Flavobacterium kayseriense TaxID=2764714 RepID=A0ABR7J4N0_9FLAO|nr:4'-phosphopantetheinyl transferase superfamily protein [Flavobacterium kayseriense]MBC5840172.1 4'-phosphopantetheinyl transferase superfamily protein [Flavobacterium kayseriense]MBC5847158.1 4'-phosphopantetheinyl transferase superfamily protein [Flavobacterium kayseriense]